ncbi:MAG: hypothetical protein GY727_00560 [Gammaproteobacteria bacterium]|nr:hypothetical protein [Gammaproteobacteria bacterium]MCP4089024.1 hypothetical protein [Gammaproteobacteria bacterium]MCP4277800.1 hypothetical protein [Gammaproteobacteria bacterium]MCP4927671.1 hypothetical protein [Gammaproteobacteria bacterium]
MAYITDITPTTPLSTDPVSQGDDQIRTLKSDVQQSFPAVDGAVSADAAGFNSAIEPITTAETNAGLVEADIVAQGYRPADTRRYGMSPSAAAADNRAALQNAINVASWMLEGSDRDVILPSGMVDVSSTVYGYYFIGNTGYNQDTQRTGRFTIRGWGSGDGATANQDKTGGTTLNFLNTTGHALDLNDNNETATANACRGIKCYDFDVSVTTDGAAVRIWGLEGENAALHRMNIINKGTGHGLWLRDSFLVSFVGLRIDSQGSASGSGILYEPVSVGGGLTSFDRVSIVGDWEVAWDFGSAYPGPGEETGSVNMLNCQATGSQTAGRFRKGVESILFDNFFMENASVNGMQFSDSCGLDITGTHTRGMAFKGGTFSMAAAAAGYLFEFGRAGADADESSIGPMVLDGVRVRTFRPMLRHNGEYNGPLRFANMAGSRQGENFLELQDTGAQYGPISFDNAWGLTGFGDGQLISDKKRVAGQRIILGDITTIDPNYTNAPALPEVMTYNIPGNNSVTFTLPDNARQHAAHSTIYMRANGGYTITFDAGTKQINGAVSPYIYTNTDSRYQMFKIIFHENSDTWWIYPVVQIEAP